MPSHPRLPRLRCGALLLLSALLVVVLAGCGGGSASGGTRRGAIDVVATTTVLGDLAREIGGDAVSVDQLLQPNSDPHEYEPRPGDVVAVSKAKVVFASGDGLDGWIDDVVTKSGGAPTVVDVGAHLPTRRRSGGDAHDRAVVQQTGGNEHGATDPHWWHDPGNVEAAVATIRDQLATANPAATATYDRNATAYLAKVEALDAGIRRCIASVPVAQRKLVTDHDALGYFADRYDVQVVGAVIPSLTTQAQPSAGDVAELARIIRREGVRAVFPESGSSRKLPGAVAKETGATAQYQLYGDSLGPDGSEAATYVGMETHNADQMVRGFTGGAHGCTIPGS